MQSSDGRFPEEGTNTQCHLTWCCSVAQLCPTLCDLVGCSSSDSPGKNSEVGCHALLQGIFQTQGLNLGLPHYKWILYDLSHQGSPHLTYLHPNIDGEVGRHKRPMGMKAWSCEKPETQPGRLDNSGTARPYEPVPFCFILPVLNKEIIS